jgi:hypothetical protein
MSHRIHRLLALALAAVVVTHTGCAGNGEGLDANGRPLDESPGPDGPLVADFDSIQEHVFTPICTVCHAGGSAPQGLRLDAASSYDSLVGVPSSEVPSLARVEPGDPDGSYLVQKLEGNASVGERMPRGGPYLDQATIAVIRQWITDGAQRSSSVSQQKPFAVAMTSPASGDRLTEAPATLIVGFTHELDQSRIDATTVTLERVADAGAPVVALPVELRVGAGNPAALLVTPRETLAPGHYRLRLLTSAFMDLAGGRVAGGAAEEAMPAVEFTVGDAP